MKTFISYHNSQSHIASKLKAKLDQFGLNCFLAHEDIDLTAKWPEVLRENLFGCHLFIPMISREFQRSFYCQQEVGAANALEKEIVPVLLDTTVPQGLIYEIQGIKFPEQDDKLDGFAWKIIDAIYKKNGRNKKRMIDGLISYLGDANSYDDAAKRAKKILLPLEFSQAQARKALRVILDNSQFEGRNPRDVVKEFIEKYQDQLRVEDVEKWKDMRSYWR